MMATESPHKSRLMAERKARRVQAIKEDKYQSPRSALIRLNYERLNIQDRFAFYPERLTRLATHLGSSEEELCTLIGIDRVRCEMLLAQKRNESTISFSMTEALFLTLLESFALEGATHDTIDITSVFNISSKQPTPASHDNPQNPQ